MAEFHPSREMPTELRIADQFAFLYFQAQQDTATSSDSAPVWLRQLSGTI
jgi:hypothetical protein